LIESGYHCSVITEENLKKDACDYQPTPEPCDCGYCIECRGCSGTDDCLCSDCLDKADRENARSWNMLIFVIILWFTGPLIPWILLFGLALILKLFGVE
jgi:hypothetical protein